MIVCLMGKAGVGKTTIAEAMEPFINKYGADGCFIIDGDDLRAETSNTDISINGREKNMRLGLSRARWLSDLGFTVLVAMQLPIKEIRDEYLDDRDVKVLITNSEPNPKDEMGYNKNFQADYSDVDFTVELTEFDENEFYNKVFKKVLVIARFQSFHIGHKIVLEEAKRLSPDVTIALRADEEDMIDLAKNINLLQNMGYNVIQSPDIDEDNSVWEDFVKDYDIVVQGNPVVIEKFQGAIDNKEVELRYVPRIGHINATKIRNALKNGDEEFAEKYLASPEVLEFLKEEIV